MTFNATFVARIARSIGVSLCLLALGLPHAARAQQPPLECNKQTACEFQLYIENDSFGAGSDRYYTNGIKFGGGVSAEPVIERVFKAPAQSVLRHITDNRGNMQFGLFLGQNLYTPKRIAVAAPQPLDRPWAAWLYIGGVAQNVEDNRLQTVELDLGVVGPAALGKPVQTGWHKLIGADKPQGWNNQLRNELGVLLAYLENFRRQYPSRQRCGGPPRIRLRSEGRRVAAPGAAAAIPHARASQRGIQHAAGQRRHAALSVVERELGVLKSV